MLTIQSQWENGIDFYIHTLNHLLDLNFLPQYLHSYEDKSPNMKRSCLLSSESQRSRAEPLNVGSERGSVAYCGAGGVVRAYVSGIWGCLVGVNSRSGYVRRTGSN